MAGSAHTQQRANWVVRFYTRARKVPTLIGKLPSGTPIPFGPYTALQLIATVGTLIVLFKTRGLWGFSGGLIDLVVAVGVAFGVGKVVGRFESGFHNPVILAAGAMASLTQPRHGTSGGRPVRMPAPVRATGRIVVQKREAPPAAEDLAPVSSTIVGRTPATDIPAGPSEASMWTPPPVEDLAATATASSAVDDRPNRLTGMQALLAQSGTERP